MLKKDTYYHLVKVLGRDKKEKFYINGKLVRNKKVKQWLEDNVFMRSKKIKAPYTFFSVGNSDRPSTIIIRGSNAKKA